jgi:hypothetical protein
MFNLPNNSRIKLLSKPIFAILVFLPLLFVGCTSVATINKIQTSNIYANKLKLKALVYLQDDLTNRVVPVRSSTNICAAYNGEINAGSGYRSALESGLMASFYEVEFVQHPISPELLKQRNADVAIVVTMQNENLALTCTEVMGFFASGIRQNAQFQVAFGMTFSDINGNIIYSFTANGSSFDTKDVSCTEIAATMATTMEKGLKQVADNISQLVYGNSELKELSKSKKIN